MRGNLFRFVGLTISAVAIHPVGAAAQPAQAARIDAVREELARVIAERHGGSDASVRVTDSTSTAIKAEPITFASPTDSLGWTRAKGVADRATGYHINVSLKEKRLWVISDSDTLLNVPVAVAKGETLSYEGHRYTFTMPRGVRIVHKKEADPVWVPPDWLYVEAAAEHGLKVATLGSRLTLPDGRKLVVRDSVVGLVAVGGDWEALPVDEHLVFNETLYIPPMGTVNRRVSGQLGKYRLDLGDGFLLHGTPYKSSIGSAATHGCVRLYDADIEWLYENVPVGTKVYVY